MRNKSTDHKSTIVELCEVSQIKRRHFWILKTLYRCYQLVHSWFPRFTVLDNPNQWCHRVQQHLNVKHVNCSWQACAYNTCVVIEGDSHVGRCNTDRCEATMCVTRIIRSIMKLQRVLGDVSLWSGRDKEQVWCLLTQTVAGSHKILNLRGFQVDAGWRSSPPVTH